VRITGFFGSDETIGSQVRYEHPSCSAWEFNRNDAFDARGFFNPAPNKVAKLRLNVFGFNIGGPVTLGKLYNPERKKTSSLQHGMAQADSREHHHRPNGT